MKKQNVFMKTDEEICSSEQAKDPCGANYKRES